jgi:hypothetical protein
VEWLWGSFLRAGLWTAIFSLAFFLIRVVAFVITALSLYRIAKQRSLAYPWLAWLPFARLYLLGMLIGQTLPVTPHWRIPYIQYLMAASAALMILGSGSLLGILFSILTVLLTALSFSALFRQYGERGAVVSGILAGVPYLEIIGCFLVMRLPNRPIPEPDQDTTVFP